MRALPPRRRQRGVALLTAMLIVALATVLAVNVLWTTGVDVRRTENLLVQDQARILALAAEDAAILLMLQVFQNREPGSGEFTRQDYAAVQVAFEVEGGGNIVANLEEVQGRFNLNNLVNLQGEPVQWAAEHFQTLLRFLIPLMPIGDSTDRGRGCSRDPLALTESVIDWIDPDDMPGLNGAEEAVYTNLVPPYRPANFWFTSPSELLAVNCFTPELYEVLAPYIVALPPRKEGGLQQLNINTARPMVLNALLPSGGPPLDPDEPTGAPFDNVNEFAATYGIADQAGNLRIDGKWFLLRVSASIGTTEVTMYSLLEARDNQIIARLRSFGGY